MADINMRLLRHNVSCEDAESMEAASDAVCLLLYELPLPEHSSEIQLKLRALHEKWMEDLINLAKQYDKLNLSVVKKQ